MSDIIKNLQDKPYATRLKILWGAVAICAVILIGIFVWNIKNVVRNANPGDILNPPLADNSSDLTNLDLLNVEKVEPRTTQLRIYFSLNNPTDDILNMALQEDIILTVNKVEYKPTEITDRQGQPFVAKILSKTQNFGVLIFPSVVGTQGTLEFDRMYFEKSPEELFSQKIDLDFNKLKTDNPLRK